MSKDKNELINEISSVNEILSQVEAPYIARLRVIGEQIGFGHSMNLLSKMWRESLEAKGYPVGGEFVVGTCKAMTVPCGCKTPHKCDWCCGSGWLTKHVKAIKDQSLKD